MSWKSIEMQVALPRTQDAGKIQEQLQKQPEILQSALTQSQLKQEKIKRTRVSESEKSEKLRLKKDKTDSSSQELEKEIVAEKDITHPYLGKSVDFNG
ncbi:hypothetical protein [Oceanobacillus sp. FSL H7-0719]|uniref:hypothetical protein n=1 Tax=Oceanobacillus sp. FSL H7-0719 TaxID=2954507 RepID=UPI00324C5D00